MKQSTPPFAAPGWARVVRSCACGCALPLARRRERFAPCCSNPARTAPCSAVSRRAVCSIRGGREALDDLASEFGSVLRGTQPAPELHWAGTFSSGIHTQSYSAPMRCLVHRRAIWSIYYHEKRMHCSPDEDTLSMTQLSRFSSHRKGAGLPHPIRGGRCCISLYAHATPAHVA